MQLNTPQKICLIFFALLLIFWAGLFAAGGKEGFYNYLYSFLYGLTPLIGGLISIFIATAWGGFQSNIGKAIFFIGIGLFLWGCGNTIWAYYNFFRNIPAPYPSLADLGYAPGMFLYGIGIFFLSKQSNYDYPRTQLISRIFIIASTVIVAILSYYLLVIFAQQGTSVNDNHYSLKTVFDILYPLGDFFALSIAVVISGLSFKYMHGKYVFDMAAVLLGVGVMFVGDLVFAYLITQNSFFNAGLSDLLFTIATFLLTFGILGFYTLKE